MTIRYTCPGCESVLKIKDEKAGTDAKCPKCKHAFVVPQPEEEDGIEIESTPDAVDLPVDMPLELTPEVAEQKDFDPIDFLNSAPARPTPARSAPVQAPAAASANSGGRKPTVAELMKDFETSKKKDKSRKPAEAPRTPAASAAETTGSAADVLARAYQQKRDSASAPPVLSRQEARSAEERSVLINFVKTRLLPGLAAVFVVGYAWSWYMNREIYEGPPLFEVTGTVTKSGKPLTGVRVEFGPDNPTPDGQAVAATSVTDAEGRYRLSAFAGQPGAPAGSYMVGLTDANGVPLVVPDDQVHQTVTESGPNEFRIQL
jgi:predicted Zn finger-like uncharacterized protein